MGIRVKRKWCPYSVITRVYDDLNGEDGAMWPNEDVLGG